MQAGDRSRGARQAGAGFGRPRRLAAALALMLATGASAADGVLGAEAAARLPIIDTHYHVVQGYDGAALLAAMDRQGVRMAGGAGGNNPQAMAALGPRLLRPAGQHPWLALHRNLDEASHANPDTPAVRQALAAIEGELRDRGARVVGEIHVNSLTTAAEPTSRFKIAGDSATLQALFALTTRYGRPLSVHAQWDHPDTVRQIATLARASPQGRLILSHCGSNTRAADIRQLFAEQPNVVCDLSARGWPLQKNRFTVYTDAALDGEWRQLIEDHADRFSVGVDLADTPQAYEASVQAIRQGLLAHLSPATAERLASRNAEAWFGLR